MGAAAVAHGAVKSPPSGRKPSALGIYVDVAYVPNQDHRINANFFRSIRAHYYVLSSLHLGHEVLDALLQGKKAWARADLPVDLVPTYDSEALNLWMALNKDQLEEYNIVITPSAARCIVNLQEAAHKCAAYRLEL